MNKDKAITLLLISHGDLCKHFLKSAQIIYQDDLEYIKILPTKPKTGKDKVTGLIRTKLKELSKDTNRLLILFDTHGATEARIVCNKKDYGKMIIKCVFGINLPMLLDCINYRDKYDLDELADRACKAGIEAIFSKNPCNKDGSE